MFCGASELFASGTSRNPSVLRGLTTAFSENCLLGYLLGVSATGIASSCVGGEGRGVSKSLLPAAGPMGKG